MSKRSLTLKYSPSILRMCFFFAFVCFLSNTGNAIYAQSDCNSDQSEVVIIYHTDSYPEETFYSFSYEGGELIHDIDFSQDTFYNLNLFSDYYNDTTFFEILTPELVVSDVKRGTYWYDTICVHQDSCIVFNITDAFNDGICCSHGYGSYEIYYNGDLARSGGDFFDTETLIFGCGEGSDCSSAIEIQPGFFTTPLMDAWYKFVPDSSGLYELSTCFDENFCDTKIWVYDDCEGLDFDENVTSSIAFSYGGCAENDLLAYHTVGLTAGEIYYIRIGDVSNSCGDLPVIWELEFLGPVQGCLDPLACNYNAYASLAGDCLYPGDPNCPAGPDLTVHQGILQGSIFIAAEDSTVMNDIECLREELCISGYGTRQLLKFDTRIDNIGDVDFYIGKTPPKDGEIAPPWELAECHNHVHFSGFAEYLLFDSDGNPMESVGFKAGFCIEDSNCNPAGTAKFNCGDQGISAHCWDVYPAYNGDSQWDCQWLDVTDVPDGIYTLVVRVNWDKLPDGTGKVETNYFNNWAQVCVALTTNDEGNFDVEVVTECDPYEDCNGEIYGPAVLDCKGDCGGSAIKGDINEDLVLDAADVANYVNAIFTETESSSCLDLNLDERLSISDIVLLNACVLQIDSTLLTDDDFCSLPFAFDNIFDTLKYSIGTIAEDSAFFELDLQISENGLLGLQIDMGEIDFLEIEYLGVYNLELHEQDGTILLWTSDHEIMTKTNDPEPFLRFHFDNSMAPESICLGPEFEAMNGLRENSQVQAMVNCKDLLEPFQDCNGVFYGSAVLDCNGVCGGTALTGDFNLDLNLNEMDISAYSSAIFNQDTFSSCLDLNNDNKLSVSDVVLLNACILQTENLISNETNLCELPIETALINDTLIYSLGEISANEGYFELDIQTNQNGFQGLQIDMGGLDFIEPELLVAGEIEMEVQGNLLLIWSKDFTPISSNNLLVPFLKFQFDASNVPGGICLDSNIEAINTQREMMQVKQLKQCADVHFTGLDNFTENQIKVFPNPVRDYSYFTWNEQTSYPINLSIHDAKGALLEQYEITDGTSFKWSRGDLANGVYFYRLTGKELDQVGKLIVL